MFDFHLLLNSVSWATFTDQAVVTLAGFALTYFVLALLTHLQQSAAYAAVICGATFLSHAGSSQVLPFFGMAPVAEGTFMFVLSITALAQAHRQFGNLRTWNIMLAGILGMLVVSFGYARWFLFALTDPTGIDYYMQANQMAEAGRNTRDAMLAMLSVFLGGFFVITIKRGLARVGVNYPWRFLLATGFVVLFTTPVFVAIAVQHNPVYEQDYLGLLFNSYVARYMVLWPIGLVLWACQKGWIPASCQVTSHGAPHPDDADFQPA